jgi:hypothetical protein
MTAFESLPIRFENVAQPIQPYNDVMRTLMTSYAEGEKSSEENVALDCILLIFSVYINGLLGLVLCIVSNVASSAAPHGLLFV